MGIEPAIWLRAGDMAKLRAAAYTRRTGRKAMTTVDRQVTHVRALERLSEKQAVEIQRLRTAMVHAMDESEHEAACAGSMLVRTNLKRIADGLRSALETP